MHVGAGPHAQYMHVGAGRWVLVHAGPDAHRPYGAAGAGGNPYVYVGGGADAQDQPTGQSEPVGTSKISWELVRTAQVRGDRWEQVNARESRCGRPLPAGGGRHSYTHVGARPDAHRPVKAGSDTYMHVEAVTDAGR